MRPHVPTPFEEARPALACVGRAERAGADGCSKIRQNASAPPAVAAKQRHHLVEGVDKRVVHRLAREPHACPAVPEFLRHPVECKAWIENEVSVIRRCWERAGHPLELVQQHAIQPASEGAEH